MRVTAMHWALFLALLIIGTALGYILADHYLIKRDERRALSEPTEE